MTTAHSLLAEDVPASIRKGLVNGKKVLALSNWETPATHYKDEQIENFCITRQIYKPGFYNYSSMDGYKFFGVEEDMTLTCLKEFRDGKWNCWMIDSPPDYRAMQKYASKATGRVLTTGLGLGLLIHLLCQNDKVTSITVVERTPSVIALVSKYLPQDSRIKIVCDDFWRFVMLDDTKWDSIIVDLWVFRGTDEQVMLYRNEVMPFSKQLAKKYPEAWITFHGFAGLPSDKEVMKALMGEDINEIIWGLGEN